MCMQHMGATARTLVPPLLVMCRALLGSPTWDRLHAITDTPASIRAAPSLCKGHLRSLSYVLPFWDCP